jgi:hypothetical protein
MKSGDKIKNLEGGTVTLPFKGEHPCFGQRQGFCTNMATWRMETQFLLLHFCDECKKRPQFNQGGEKWTPLE